ncbi:bifunctional DNA primase/polymerase [Methyloceanibacter sp.]|uniref:bifunctional DNA primase/polymerase n=1 Tax=Methyloceanibacter sp. TaxID=1965321 RepID=UPI003C72C7EB
MATERSSSIEAAKRYLARGWSVLPLRSGDKRPLIRWEHLQHQRPSEKDVAEGIVRANWLEPGRRQL